MEYMNIWRKKEKNQANCMLSVPLQRSKVDGYGSCVADPFFDAQLYIRYVYVCTTESIKIRWHFIHNIFISILKTVEPSTEIKEKSKSREEENSVHIPLLLLLMASKSIGTCIEFSPPFSARNISRGNVSQQEVIFHWVNGLCISHTQWRSLGRRIMCERFEQKTLGYM